MRRKQAAEEEVAKIIAEEEKQHIEKAGSARGDESNIQQNEIDENGFPFVRTSDGITIFGEITDDTGLQSAPIKLSEGVVDEKGNGYGLQHIEARHGEQIRNAGFESVEDFVKYVAENYDKDNIKVGKKRVNGSGTFIIQTEDDHSNLLYIELSRDGSYWNVNSGGVFRKGYSRKRKNVESNTELSTSDTAISDKSFVQTNSVDGSKSADTHSDNQRFSDDKVTKSSNKDKELGEEIANEREALRGVPDMVDDTPQDARTRGYRRVNGHKIDRQAPQQAAKGKKVSIRFSEKVMAPGRIMVIESSQLQPSHIQGVRNPLHFIDEAQPKNRKDVASRHASQKIASQIRPEEITSSVTAYTGAPSVNSRGEVIQGNNRSDALRLMWEQYPEQAAQYKAYLMEHAEEFGLNAEEIAQMEAPVLLNMLNVTDEQAINLGQYVAQDTESGGIERIKAPNTIKKLGGDFGLFAEMLLESDDPDMSFSELLDRNSVKVLKWLNQKGVISNTQYASAFDAQGHIIPEAKNDLRDIMFQSLFQGNSTELKGIFNSLPVKAQRAILATAHRDNNSPESERMLAEIQDSIKAYYELSQYADFANAKNYTEASQALDDWCRQFKMDDATGESYLPAERYSHFSLKLASLYKGKTQTFVQGLFNQMFDLIQGTQAEDLFNKPNNTPRTLEEAIKETLNIDYNGKKRSNNVAVHNPDGQRGQQGSRGDAKAGERTEDGNEPIDNSTRIERDSGQLRNDEERKDDLSEINEISSAERTEMESRIVDWLSEENLSRANGKTREEIFDEFGNELMPIAYIPTQFISLVSTTLKDQRIYCGKGYFIDHALRNHARAGSQISVEDVDVSKYLNIQTVLDNPGSVAKVCV